MNMRESSRRSSELRENIINSASTYGVVEVVDAAHKLEAEGYPQEAISVYKAWLANSSSAFNYAIQFNLGVLLFGLGKIEAAEAAYESAIFARPDFLEARFNLSVLLESSHRLLEASGEWLAIIQKFDITSDTSIKIAETAREKLTNYVNSKLGTQAANLNTSRAALIGEVLRSSEHHLLNTRTYSKSEQNLIPKNLVSRRYVIVAPPFEHTSAGIRVLYDLQKWLVRANLDAIVCTWFPNYPIDQFVDDIVIYPEVAPGNLLNATRVIRYILNTPGKLGYGDKTYAPTEILIAYNKELATYSNGRILQVPSIEEYFNSHDCEKFQNAVYVGKGKDLGLHPDGCVAITKTFPATRKEMAQLLRSVETLYIYDDFSMIAREAQLCGCQVRLIRNDGVLTDYPELDFPTIDEFQIQLDDFISMTQNLFT